MSDQPNNQNSGNRKLHAIYLVIIFLLGGLCIFLSFQYRELKVIVAEREITINQVINEREDVKSDLEDLKAQYAELQTTDAALNAELTAKRAYIDSLLVEAEKHKGDKFIIAKLKKETQTLREIMKGYIVTIDSLNT
jgi:chromosome segregation ATPase